MRDADVIRWLVEEGPAVLDRKYEPDRCLAATKHGIAVCNYFGVKATPWKVDALIGNKAWIDWMETNPDEHIDHAPEDVWSVGIVPEGVTRDGRPGYAGHLVFVAEAEDEQLLVDLSLGQASRPHHQMTLPPAAAFILPGWPQQVGFISKEFDECAVVYIPKPEKDWFHATDWKRKPPLAGEMIRAIKEAA